MLRYSCFVGTVVCFTLAFQSFAIGAQGYIGTYLGTQPKYATYENQCLASTSAAKQNGVGVGQPCGPSCGTAGGACTLQDWKSSDGLPHEDCMGCND